MLAWTVRPFEALSAGELYALLRLRQQVFVVEQRCVYLDCDGLDPACFHVLGRSDDGALAAYARLVPPGVAFAEASIGRVVTAPAARGGGRGRSLMVEAIREARAAFGPGPIKIGAQRYLTRFYLELGFRSLADDYDEDGIPHVHMVLDTSTPSPG